MGAEATSRRSEIRTTGRATGTTAGRKDWTYWGAQTHSWNWGWESGSESGTVIGYIYNWGNAVCYT